MSLSAATLKIILIYFIDPDPGTKIWIQKIHFLSLNNII